jgi:hypothetical protein
MKFMHLKLLSQRSCSRSRRPHSLSSSVFGRPTQAQGICHHHHNHNHNQWLYSPLRTLDASHRMFRNLTKTRLDDLPARRKGLYLHRTTQHRNTKTNTYAPSRIRTHSSSNQNGQDLRLKTARLLGLVRESVCSSNSLFLLKSVIERGIEGSGENSSFLHLRSWRGGWGPVALAPSCPREEMMVADLRNIVKC